MKDTIKAKFIKMVKLHGKDNGGITSEKLTRLVFGNRIWSLSNKNQQADLVKRMKSSAATAMIEQRKKGVFIFPSSRGVHDTILGYKWVTKPEEIVIALDEKEYRLKRKTIEDSAYASFEEALQSLPEHLRRTALDEHVEDKDEENPDDKKDEDEKDDEEKDDKKT